MFRPPPPPLGKGWGSPTLPSNPQLSRERGVLLQGWSRSVGQRGRWKWLPEPRTTLCHSPAPTQGSAPHLRMGETLGSPYHARVPTAQSAGVLTPPSLSIALSGCLGDGLVQAGRGVPIRAASLQHSQAWGGSRDAHQMQGAAVRPRSAGHWLQPCSSRRWERRKGRGLALAPSSCQERGRGDSSSVSRCKWGTASGQARTCQKRSRSPLVFPKQRKQPCIAGSRVLGLCWLVIIR